MDGIDGKVTIRLYVTVSYISPLSANLMFHKEMLLCYIVDIIDKTTGMVRFRFNNLQQYYICTK